MRISGKYLKDLRPYQVRCMLGNLAILTCIKEIYTVYVNSISGDNIVELINISDNTENRDKKFLFKCTEIGLESLDGKSNLYRLFSIDSYSRAIGKTLKLSSIESHCTDSKNRLTSNEVKIDKPYYLVYNWGKLSNPNSIGIYKVIVKSKQILSNSVNISLIHLECISGINHDPYRIETLRLTSLKKLTGDKNVSRWMCEIPGIKYNK